MYFEFYISKDSEKKQLIEMFQEDDPLGLKDRAKQYNFPVDLAVKINSEPLQVWKPELLKLLDNTYDHNLKFLKESASFFMNYWRKNEGRFFPILEDLFKKKLPTYYVLLAHYVAGTSDWHGVDICTNAYSHKWKGKDCHAYFLLFEVILSQVFMMVRKEHDEKSLSDFDLWKVSELVAFVVLHKEWDYFNYIKKTNYEQIDNHIEEAMVLYNNKQNLKDFIYKSIELLQRRIH